jgi:cyclic pyranopterin phosphate synthase
MQLVSPVSSIQRGSALLTDSFGRNINYLRVSVTDRCNLRCFYCMNDKVQFLPKQEVLSLEELERLCASFIRLGVRKLRLTGGEPLARPGIMNLVGRLGQRLAKREFSELTLTTNGTLLAQHAAELAAAGVRRINVSLDTLTPAKFRNITGHDGLGDVIAGIDAARQAGIAVRINTVALGGVNDGEYDRLLRWCGEHDCDMALIEMMPLGGYDNPGTGHYLPLDRVRHHLEANWTLEPLEQGSGPAVYARVAETGKKIGFIMPMSHSFCQTCNRVRLTCAGTLELCLAQERGIDLRQVLREGANDAEIDAAIVAAVVDKPLEHHLTYDPALAKGTRRMWQLGG